ncbi:MAG: riboflavin synthase [Solirubrobacteraceae bacterium]
MFTGIIESVGVVENIIKNLNNIDFVIKCSFCSELKIDQSVAHNGVCLTIVKINEDQYTVTAIEETLNKSNLGNLKVGDLINLERATKLGDRLDGHIVQGHIDQTGKVLKVEEFEGSWEFTFGYDKSLGNVTVEKGSICVNGTSLTVVNSKKKSFSVALIPYTYKNTNFNKLKIDDTVNLEFDILGKYIAKLIPTKF